MIPPRFRQVDHEVAVQSSVGGANRGTEGRTTEKRLLRAGPSAVAMFGATIVAMMTAGGCGAKIPPRTGNLTLESMMGRHRLLATNNETCAINSSGKVACWNHADTSEPLPRVIHVPLPAPAKTIHEMGNERCAVLETARVYCWTHPADPQLRPARKGAVRMFTAGADTCLIDTTGRLLCDAEDATGLPLRTLALPDVVDGVGNAEGGCVVTVKGEVRCWFSRAQRGPGTTNGIIRTDAWPVPLSGRARWLGGGTEDMCAWVEPGEVYCWNLSMEQPPQPIPDSSDAAALALGCNAGCTVDKEGGVRCWSSAPLAPYVIPAGAGKPPSAPRPPGPSPVPTPPKRLPVKGSITPENIPDAHGAVELSLGCHLCALFGDDTVYCMGDSGQGSSGQRGASIRPYHFNPFATPLK